MKNNKKLYQGVGALVLSLAPLVLPKPCMTALVLTAAFAFFCGGIILISEWYIMQETGKSLYHVMRATSQNRRTYAVIAVVAGLLLEMFALYLGGLWYYPFYTVSTYLVIALTAGYAVYFLAIVFSYEAIKILFDKHMISKKITMKPFWFEKYAFMGMFIVGIAGIIFSIVKIVKTFLMYKPQLVVNSLQTPYVSFAFTILFFFSFWFFLEGVEYFRHRSSLIKDLFHGYWVPIAAILVASTVLALYMELQNLPIALWVYSKHPLGGIMFLGLPLWIWITWPFQYIAFISLYRAFGDKPAEIFWKSPTRE